MADVIEDAELFEQLAIVAAVGIGAYFVYQIYKAFIKPGNTFNLFGGQIGEGKIVGPALGFADGSVMTAGVASSIGRILYVAPAFEVDEFGAEIVGTRIDRSSYQLSTDGLQLWFPDGSYYDNRDGHLYLKDGTDRGMAF